MESFASIFRVIDAVQPDECYHNASFFLTLPDWCALSAAQKGFEHAVCEGAMKYRPAIKKADDWWIGLRS